MTFWHLRVAFDHKHFSVFTHQKVSIAPSKQFPATFRRLEQFEEVQMQRRIYAEAFANFANFTITHYTLFYLYREKVESRSYEMFQTI